MIDNKENVLNEENIKKLDHKNNLKKDFPK